MVNTRLVLVLESKELLPIQQNGFRKMRSTQNCLENVTSNILSALNQKNIALCVSFDIEKAYDKTWRYHILKTLKDLEFKGNLPKFIENFLVRRFFKTKIGVTLSSDHIQEQGVPQGSVISCTLFSLALNGILSVIPNNVLGSLYVDDLLIYSVGNYQTALERRVQLAINHVNNWATSHGFKFSTAKTVSILFHRKRKIQPPPQLFLNNQPIPSKTSIKYLGMILDEKLTWQENIKDLKIDCTKRLDLLKTLSHTTWGSDRTTMLRLYRSIIRSKLDYCSFIYACLLYTSPSPRDKRQSRMPSSA